jgi:nucleotidyltransferase substrate binding protein (TIGR01987 family)
MARLAERLTDAEAALATLEELVNRDNLSIAERDGAILRLVYTFEAAWKAAALLLEQKEGIAVASPKGAIRASRRARLLSDNDTEDAIRIADDRNLTVHMYRENLGVEIAERLAGHAVVLRRWLDALRQRAASGT